MSCIRIEFPFGKVELPIQKCVSCDTWVFASSSCIRCSQCQKIEEPTPKVEVDVIASIATQDIATPEATVTPFDNFIFETSLAEPQVIQEAPSQEIPEAEIFSEEIPLTQVDATDESEDEFEDIPLPPPEGSSEEDEFEEVVPQKIIHQKNRVENLPSELEACVPKLVELVKNFPGKGISFLEEQYRENFESISRPALQKVLKDARQKKLIAKQGEKRFAVYFPA